MVKHILHKENENPMKKNRWFIWMSLLLSLGLVLAACGAPPAPPPSTAAPDQLTPAAVPAQTEAAPAEGQATPTLPPVQPMPATTLAGTNWTLTSIEALGAESGTLPGADITLDFGADGQANGAAGCNTYNGTYTVTGDTLTFGPLITTRMACPEPVMRQEQAYLAMLANPSTIKQEADRLTLTFDGGKTVYKYKSTGTGTAAPSTQPVASTGLANTSWKLVSVEAMGASNAPVPGTEITLAFSADNQVSGSAGCNTYNGAYQLAGDQITIGPLATTRMMCPDEVMLQEQGYLALLQTPGTVAQQGTNLVLTLDGGKTIFTYTSSGAAPTTAAPATGVAPASNLANTNWKLISVDAFGTNNAPVGGVEITLNFGADNSVNGSSGCNNYSGSYQLNGDQLVMGPLVSTMKACSPAIMGQESFYLTTLQKPAQVTQADNRLTLKFDGGKIVYNYEKVNTAAPATGLPGTKWDLRYLVDSAKQSKSSVLANTQITLIFGPAKQLSGNDGCNQYSGTYDTNGNQITIGPLVTTMMACAPEVMQQESTYMIALQSATSFEQSAQQLIITHPAGRLEYAPLP
jgi:heat shock protein HslJ